MRFAMVAGAVKKALAISSVVNPQISRNVSATCAVDASAGWQHVKISRSWSSSTVLSSVDGGAAVPASSRPASSASEASKPSPTPDNVNRLKAARGDEPRTRIVRDAVACPLFDSRRECVVQRFLSQIEVAEDPDQCGENASRLGAINIVDSLPHKFARQLVHASDCPKLTRRVKEGPKARDGERTSDGHISERFAVRLCETRLPASPSEVKALDQRIGGPFERIARRGPACSLAQTAGDVIFADVKTETAAAQFFGHHERRRAAGKRDRRRVRLPASTCG